MRAGADQAALEKFDEFANKFGEQLNGLLSDATDQAQALRETMLEQFNTQFVAQFAAVSRGRAYSR